MSLLPQEIIRKKRLGEKLEREDIASFFGGYLKGDVADYQVSAMLMAIVLNGMTSEEATELTLFMRDTGQVMNWSPLPRDKIVDKHSTGGVGDKTSLVLLPLCVLEGLTVPMIAGRGLGHTGGTLDKLESIPGMNVFLNPDAIKTLLKSCHGLFLGQTSDVAPLDKRLYAMRDVTDTVESVPLITASILSKKLSEGIGGLVMDVKFGSGAFMVEKDAALKLAESISAVAMASGLKICCLLTDMGSPLGDSAGNALEIAECVAIMKGAGPKSTIDLTLELAIEMIRLGDPKLDYDKTRERLLSHLSSGRAFEVFCKVVSSQGGDVRVLEDSARLPSAKMQIPVEAYQDGYISEVDCRSLGLAIIELGGGRLKTTDKIDPSVGLTQLKRVGDKVAKGELLAMIHTQSETIGQQVKARIQTAYRFGAAKKSEPLIWRKI